jgi:purine-nucleoside phosphorylase
MTLIHTALLSEAQSLVEDLKLTLISKNPRIYTNDKIVLIVSGIGKDNTLSSLSQLFKSYKITKAINIGIVGCSNISIDIGTVVCTNKQLNNMKHIHLKTVEIPKIAKDKNDFLYDMEAKYFEEICLKSLEDKDIYIFKIVSDYLDDTIPKKEFVKQLIKKNIKRIKVWI